MPQPPMRGRGEIRRFAEAIIRAFPDFQYELLGQVCVAADGSKCALHWRITATHTAPLDPPGFAPTGRQMRQEGVDLLEFRDGRISRILTCFDALAGAEQLLGLTLRPPPGSIRERVAVLFQRLLAFRPLTFLDTSRACSEANPRSLRRSELQRDASWNRGM